MRITRSMFVALLLVAIPALRASAQTPGALTTTQLEEAFVDALGSCGPSSLIAESADKTLDPGVRHALRDALIVEAADDAAGIAGSNKSHSDCMRKNLQASGYSDVELSVLPDCIEHDWPEPLDNLGQCIAGRSRLELKMKKAAS
jgi:hypothetical protein